MGVAKDLLEMALSAFRAFKPCERFRAARRDAIETAQVGKGLEEKGGWLLRRIGRRGKTWR